MGQVRILIDYYVNPEDYNAFVHAVHQMKNVRMRDGAMSWGIFQDMKYQVRGRSRAMHWARVRAFVRNCRVYVRAIEWQVFRSDSQRIEA
jgi:hypothetical protein